MSPDKRDPKLPTHAGEVDAFLAKVAATPRRRAAASASRGRLLFAMDATASRDPTWDQACNLQGQMFEETERLGGLDVQLCFYRGFDELRRSRWLRDASSLHRAMSAVRCVGGLTQIDRVLQHALHEARGEGLNAMVFVGDVIEEDVDRLCHRAGELGLLRVPVFVFHEGGEARSALAFRQVARLSGGAYCRFDLGSATQLRDLLRAVAAYAAGGTEALARFERCADPGTPRLSHQLK